MNDLAEQLRVFTGELSVSVRLWRKLVREVVARHGIAEAGAGPLLWIGRLGGNLRQNVLAEHAGMEGPSLVRILDELQADGLITREPDPSDRRANLINLTPAGTERLKEIEADLVELRAQTFAAVTAEEIASASKVFATIRAAAAAREED